MFGSIPCGLFTDPDFIQAMFCAGILLFLLTWYKMVDKMCYVLTCVAIFLYYAFLCSTPSLCDSLFISRIFHCCNGAIYHILAVVVGGLLSVTNLL